MKGKYITTSILLACLSKPGNLKKDIHEQLKETIAEHRKIMRAFEKLSKSQHKLFIMNGKEAA
jgi:hypothetical protein